jgi:tungstate transport system ATP-binding protein
MDTALYRMRDVKRSFDGRTALSVDSLEVARGEIVAFVGPNGAGKTTLLRLAAFLDRPTAGEMQFEGRRVNGSNGELPFEARRSVTMVERPPVMFDASVAFNMSYGLKVRGAGRSECAKRCGQMLERLGVDGLEHRNARHLSSGETQRVAVARALVLATEVLLLDEPTSNIDPDFIGQLEGLILDTARRNGTTVLFTTHDPDQAQRMATRVIHLLGGRIVNDTKPVTP